MDVHTLGQPTCDGREAAGVGKHVWVVSSVRVELIRAQPEGIGLQEASGGGIIVPHAYRHEPASAFERLARKSPAHRKRGGCHANASESFVALGLDDLAPPR